MVIEDRLNFENVLHVLGFQALFAEDVSLVLRKLAVFFSIHPVLQVIHEPQQRLVPLERLWVEV